MENKFNTKSLIEGMSYALDVAEKKYLSHSKHVAYLSLMIAKELGLTDEQQEDVYYAALLHDIGASNANSRIEHCKFGSDMVKKLPINKSIIGYILYHHEHVNGTGPFGKKENEISIPSQIICLADAFDYRFRRIEDINIEKYHEIKEWASERKGITNIEILDAFSSLIKKEYVLLDYFNSEFSTILKKKVKVQSRVIGVDDVKQFAQVFSEIIDRRSPFTYRHSVGIAELISKIVKNLGYDYEVQSEMYIAALLHDIGKLMIPNSIIDKPGKLEEDERFEINKHTYYTRWVLEQIDGFDNIVNYAANHHEKLNGTGYPQQLKDHEIGELDRVMAICDIYQALTEERPYRTPMNIENVWSIMDDMVSKNELDGNLLEKIKVILREELE